MTDRPNEKPSPATQPERKREIAVQPGDVAGAAKLAGGALLRTAGAIAKGAVDGVTGTATRIVAGEPVSDIIDDGVAEVTPVARTVIGADAGEPANQSGRSGRRRGLRERGDNLIYRSWNAADQAKREHPAFDHILEELTPDEARILRFLAVAGVQPAIDIRTKTPLDFGSQRLAAGISFIVDMAGCAWPHRSRHYLGNLNRLGLVRFSAEPVVDFRRYYLLDAHPDAIAAMHRAKRTIAVYRSIYLSVFGEEFCAECFTTDGYDAGGWATHDSGDVYWGKGPRLP